MILMWFRQDLRLTDNRALFQAAHLALETGQPLVCCYIATPKLWESYFMSSRQQSLIQSRVDALQKDLNSLGIPLHCIIQDNHQQAENYLYEFCLSHKVRHLFLNFQYELNEWQRDERLILKTAALGLQIHGYHDQLLIPPSSVTNAQGEMYKVFTPFRQKWLSCLPQYDIQCLPKPKSLIAHQQSHVMPLYQALTLTNITFEDTHWPLDEQSIIQQLRNFCKDKAEDKAENS